MKNKVVFLLMILSLLGCSSNGNSKENTKKLNIEVTVKDISAPTITIEKDEVSLFLGDTFSLTDCKISVFDNFDKSIRFKTSGEVDTSKVGSYTITVSAKDKAGNATNRKIIVTVKEKESVKKDNTNSSPGANAGNNGGTNSGSNPSIPQPPIISKHPLSGKQYLFTAGYDNVSASQACSSDLLSVPNASGSCSAIYDGSGEPIGVQLK